MQKTRYGLSLLLPILLLMIGFSTGALPRRGNSFNFYSSDRDGLLSSPPGFRLVERSGIFPGVNDLAPSLFPAFSRRMPGVAALCDFDRDGFDDVVTIYNKPNKFGYLQIFHNNQGSGFSEVSGALGLEATRDGNSFTAAACADLDNDGWVDLILAGIAQDILIFKNQNRHFVPHGRISTYDETRALNIFDANEDGFLDVYAVNYRRLNGDADQVKLFLETNAGVRRVKNLGARDRIYLNRGDGSRFRPIARKNLTENGSSWAAGVGDFNGDNHADVFVAEDFGLDVLFTGNGKGQFKNETERMLGPVRSRYSMSAEVGDINGDGVPDIYVTNRPKPGLRRGFNSLWISQTSGKFKDEAIERGVDGCGWSWGVQFTDFNQDGWSDIIVANGMYGEAPTDYWYAFEYLAGNPRYLKKFYSPQERYSPEVTVSTNHRKCLFLGGPSGKFRDAATQIGFSDQRIARAVVAFDFDHDGDEDVLLMSPYSGPILFENKLDKPGRWLAIRLKDQKGNATGIGAKISLRTSERMVVASHFPLNGFESQHSGETFFTFRTEEVPQEIRIRWPNGKTSDHPIEGLNQRMTLGAP